MKIEWQRGLLVLSLIMVISWHFIDTLSMFSDKHVWMGIIIPAALVYDVIFYIIVCTLSYLIIMISDYGFNHPD